MNSKCSESRINNIIDVLLRVFTTQVKKHTPANWPINLQQFHADKEFLWGNILDLLLFRFIISSWDLHSINHIITFNGIFI